MKKILIDYEPWQIRIAITRNGELQNIYFSTHVHKILERSFFKGIAIKVLPGIQTAFVDIGQEKAGFLHISEIDRELAIQAINKYIQVDDYEEKEPEKKSRPKRDISKILKEGDPILVQVSKEPIYEKGAKLTTCFTIPGRFLVLMPNIPRIGVSKKIEDREERIRLKNIIRNHLPEGMGVIIRTTSNGREEKALLKDLNYLVREWRNIVTTFDKAEPQEKIHEDLDLSLQIVRDHLDDDIEAVITDNKKNQDSIYKFVKKIAPEYTHKIKLYDGIRNIFDFYNVEQQIEQGLEQKAFLKSGGSLVIETTEAMSVVDVNTSRFVGKTNLEDTIFKTNLEAAEEVVRQLNLRNIGGLIVIDFIDMAIPANRQKLFQFFEKILRERDKFQSVVLKVSEFGIVQMTRKRSGKTLIQQLTSRCSTCKGLGFIKSVQTESYSVLRNLKQDLHTKKLGPEIIFIVSPHIFEYITSIEYNAILSLEKLFKCKLTLLSDNNLVSSEYKIKKK